MSVIWVWYDKCLNAIYPHMYIFQCFCMICRFLLHRKLQRPKEPQSRWVLRVTPSREMIAKTCIFWYGTYWTTLKLIKKVGHLLQCKHVFWSHLDSFFGFINQRMLDTCTHNTTTPHKITDASLPLGDLDQQELWRDDWSRKDTWLVRRLPDM